MTTKKPNKLMRHATFIDKDSDQESVLEHTFKEYKLTILPSHYQFTLQFPDGSIVDDSFEGLAFRRSLYENLEDGEIFSWLVERQHAIELEDEMNRFITLYIPLEYGGYNVSIDKDKSKGWIIFPEHVRSFDIDEIYLQIAELPLIADGRFNNELRSKLEKYGLSLPATPYELGFSIKAKR